MISFTVPIYEATVLVSISDDPLRERATVNSIFGPGPNVAADVVGGLCSSSEDGSFGLFLRSDDLGVNTVAHELFHLTMRLAEHYDIKVDVNNHEALAYLHGWVAAEVYKAIDCFKSCQETNEVLKPDGGECPRSAD